MAWRMVEGETPLQATPTQKTQEQSMTALSEFQRIGSKFGLDRLTQLPGASYVAAGLEGASQLGMLPLRGIGALLGKPVSAEEEKAGMPASIYSLMSPETRQQLAPQGKFQETAQDIASRALPSVLLGGGNLLAPLASSVAGPIARKAIEMIPEQYMPSWLPAAADITASLATAGKLQKTAPKTLAETRKLAQPAGKLAAKEFSVAAKGIQSTLSEAADLLGKETSESLSKQAMHALKTVENNINQGKLNVADAYDLSVSLNSTIRKGGKDIMRYLLPIKNQLKDIIHGSGITEAKNWSKLSDADKIKIFQSTERYLSDVMPIRPKLGLHPSLAITLPSWLAVRGAEGLEYAGRAMTIKPVRDHYLKLAEATIKNAPATVVKELNTLSNLSKKYNLEPKEQDIQEQPLKVGKWRRVDQ